MKALTITFELDGMTVDGWIDQGRGKTDRYAEVAGLEAKIWLAGESVDRVGAVYLFTDEAARTAFLEGPLMARIRSHPNYVDVEARTFDVVDELTAATQGTIEVVG